MDTSENMSSLETENVTTQSETMLRPIVVTLPGTGESDPSDIKRYPTDNVEVVFSKPSKGSAKVDESFENSGNVAIAGFSGYGMTAIREAANSTGDVSGVFVVDPPYTDSASNYYDSLDNLASRENNVPIYFVGGVAKTDDRNDANMMEAMKYYSDQGGTAMFITNGVPNHGAYKNGVYGSIFYDNLVGFLSGSGDIDPNSSNFENYRFTVCSNGVTYTGEDGNGLTVEELKSLVNDGTISISQLSPFNNSGTQEILSSYSLAEAVSVSIKDAINSDTVFVAGNKTIDYSDGTNCYGKTKTLLDRYNSSLKRLMSVLNVQCDNITTVAEYFEKEDIGASKLAASLSTDQGVISTLGTTTNSENNNEGDDKI